ncbi:MAG: hypothetical protein R3F11_09275 [Verrucomicrobiales bacterium]
MRSPKSLGVRTSALPKWCIQTRFTITRAVSGLSGEAIFFRELPLAALGDALRLALAQHL